MRFRIRTFRRRRRRRPKKAGEFLTLKITSFILVGVVKGEAE